METELVIDMASEELEEKQLGGENKGRRTVTRRAKCDQTAPRPGLHQDAC